MTALYFTMVALPPIKTGETPVHMYIEEGKRVRDKDVIANRNALEDIRRIEDDLLRENVDGSEERLLKDGEIPFDGEPVCSFAIACQYDPEHNIPHYKRIDLIWITKNIRKFAKVPSVARELYDLTFDTLRNREKIDMRRVNASKWRLDKDNFKKISEDFTEYCSTITSRIAHRKFAHDTNARRFDCEFLKNGYCSPMHSDCPCFVNGKCVEIK